MPQLEPMRYTTTAAATAGRDSASRRARRIVLITSAAAGAFGLVLLAAPCDAQTVTPKATTVTESETTTAAIRPFRVNVPEEALVDLRRRIAATRWPEKETVADQSQGVPLATMQELARYWATDYDWRKVRGETERACRNSSPRSMGWTFISFTFVRNMKMRCRSSSRTDGPARSSSS